MAKGYRRWVMALSLAIGLWSCDRVEPSATPDRGGETATAATPAIADVQRAVALSSLPADVLHQLAPDKLVGVAHDRAVAGRDDLSQYPDIGDGRDFDRDAIADLDPDLVVGLAGVHERVLAQLSETGVPTLSVTVDGWDSLFDTIEELASVTDSDPDPLLDRYAAIRDRLGIDASMDSDTEDDSDDAGTEDTAGDTDGESADAEVEASDSAGAKAEDEDETIHKDAAKESDREPIANLESAMILASLDPLFSLNRYSWGGSAIALFAENLSAELEENRSAAGYVTLTPEAIVEAAPETILVVETPGSEAPLAGFEALPFWEELDAVQNDRVFLVDYYGFVRPASLDDIDAAIVQLSEIFGVELPVPASESPDDSDERDESPDVPGEEDEITNEADASDEEPDEPEPDELDGLGTNESESEAPIE